jgi:hypothetical protein
LIFSFNEILQNRKFYLGLACDTFKMPSIQDDRRIQFGIQEEKVQSGTWFLTSLFNRLFQMPPKRAQNASMYYNLLILSHPATFSTIARSTRILFHSRSSWSALRIAASDLLSLGFIAQIVPFLNDEIENRLKSEAYLPIDPKIFGMGSFYDFNSRLYREDELNAISKEYLNAISEVHEEKFGYDALRTKLRKRNGDCNVSIYYKPRWMFYNTLNNIKTSSELCMICSVSDFNDHNDIFKGLAEAGPKIKVIILKDVEDKILVPQNWLKNNTIEIKIALKGNIIPTSKMVILDNMFALDGRNLLQEAREGPLTLDMFALDGKILREAREDPLNLSTIYLDQKPIVSLTNTFKAIWERLAYF